MRFERIGRYDVTALLGEGDMGQVWQATDTQLNRQVALKILPDAFAAGRMSARATGPDAEGLRHHHLWDDVTCAC